MAGSIVTLGKMIPMAALALLVSGCADTRERIFGSEVVDAAGLPFRASLSRGSDRRDFTVTVRATGVSLDEARESARFRATLYCIDRYGGSLVDWVIDPATGDWAVSRTQGGLTVAGRCVAR